MATFKPVNIDYGLGIRPLSFAPISQAAANAARMGLSSQRNRSGAGVQRAMEGLFDIRPDNDWQRETLKQVYSDYGLDSASLAGMNLNDDRLPIMLQQRVRDAMSDQRVVDIQNIQQRAQAVARGVDQGAYGVYDVSALNALEGYYNGEIRDPGQLSPSAFTGIDVGKRFSDYTKDVWADSEMEFQETPEGVMVYETTKVNKDLLDAALEKWYADPEVQRSIALNPELEQNILAEYENMLTARGPREATGYETKRENMAAEIRAAYDYYMSTTPDPDPNEAYKWAYERVRRDKMTTEEIIEEDIGTRLRQAGYDFNEATVRRIAELLKKEPISSKYVLDIAVLDDLGLTPEQQQEVYDIIMGSANSQVSAIQPQSANTQETLTPEEEAAARREAPTRTTVEPADNPAVGEYGPTNVESDIVTSPEETPPDSATTSPASTVPPPEELPDTASMLDIIRSYEQPADNNMAAEEAPAPPAAEEIMSPEEFEQGARNRDTGLEIDTIQGGVGAVEPPAEEPPVAATEPPVTEPPAAETEPPAEEIASTVEPADEEELGDLPDDWYNRDIGDAELTPEENVYNFIVSSEQTPTQGGSSNRAEKTGVYSVREEPGGKSYGAIQMYDQWSGFLDFLEDEGIVSLTEEDKAKLDYRNKDNEENILDFIESIVNEHGEAVYRDMENDYMWKTYNVALDVAEQTFGVEEFPWKIQAFIADSANQHGGWRHVIRRAKEYLDANSDLDPNNEDDLLTAFVEGRKGYLRAVGASDANDVSPEFAESLIKSRVEKVERKLRSY